MVFHTLSIKQPAVRRALLLLSALFALALQSGCASRGLPQSAKEPPALLAQHEPLLSRPVAPLAAHRVTDADVQDAIRKLYDAAKPYRPPNELALVGLAGPQIGIDMPVILVDTGIKEDGTGTEALKAYINPVIVWKSDSLVEHKEGCFSVDRRLIGTVPRASRIRISARDSKGNLIFEELTGFTARIFQHEVDHLRGVRFPDRVGDMGTLHWVEPEKLLAYAQDSASWPRFSWDRWIDMKTGHYTD